MTNIDPKWNGPCSFKGADEWPNILVGLPDMVAWRAHMGQYWKEHYRKPGMPPWGKRKQWYRRLWEHLRYGALQS